MHVTQPDAAAMQLVQDEFKALWAQVAAEIDQAFCRADSSQHSGIETIKGLALTLKCSIEKIHIARTAPIEGGDRMLWRSQRFSMSLTQAHLQESYRRQLETGERDNRLGHAAHYAETEPWRETSAWYLTTHVYRPLFRARFALEKLLKDSAFSALFSVHDRPHETVRFGGVWGNPSWARLLKDLAIDQCSRLNPIRGKGIPFYEDVVLTADDYDAINAHFDEVPEFNYAAKLAGKRKAGADPTETEPDRKFRRLFPSEAFQVDGPGEFYRDSGGLASMLRLPPLGPEQRKLDDWIQPYIGTQWERVVWTRYQQLTEMSEADWNLCKEKAAAEGIDYQELHARNVLPELQLFVIAKGLPHPGKLPGDRFRENVTPQPQEKQGKVKPAQRRAAEAILRESTNLPTRDWLATQLREQGVSIANAVAGQILNEWKERDCLSSASSNSSAADESDSSAQS